jgi:hypothetical protein
VIHEKQELYLSILKKIFAEQMNYDAELQFINIPPVEDYSWKRIWEIRESKGLDFDKNDPEQQKIIIPSDYNISTIKLNVGN